MQRTMLIGIVLVGVIAGVVSGLKCLTCSYIAGVLTNEACLNGKTTKSEASTDPVCVTFAMFDSNKVLLQMTRSSYLMANPPNANHGCYGVPTEYGQMMYSITCTCSDKDNCNNFVISNCKCERASSGDGTNGTTVSPPTRATGMTSPTTTRSKGRSCLTCSHIPGALEDEACLNGKTTSTSPSSDPICVVFGYFDSNKHLLQVERSSYPTANIPMPNDECFQLTDLQGKTVYSLTCVCSDTDNCNNFVISNCKCEKASPGGTTVSPTIITTTPTTTTTDPNSFTTTSTATTVNTTSTDTSVIITVTTTTTVTTVIPKTKN